jgi:serine/threonine protein kinase
MSRNGTYDCSDWWTLGVMLYQFLTGGRPVCSCDPKKKQWCTFGYSEEEEKLAKDKNSGGQCYIKIDYSPIKDPDTKDFLQKLFVVDPHDRLGYHNTQALKDHPYFKSLDFEKLSKGEVEAPYKPDGGVHAESIADVGAFDKSEFKKVKMTDEDNAYYKDFYFAHPKNLQRELVGALIKMDDPALQAAAAAKDDKKAESGCCVIL